MAVIQALERIGLRKLRKRTDHGSFGAVVSNNVLLEDRPLVLMSDSVLLEDQPWGLAIREENDTREEREI